MKIISRSCRFSEPSKRRGFTIVELLVVIVIIGILASLTIVAYNGISRSARVATVNSDLENAAKQLGIAETLSGGPPGDIATLNNGNGLAASSGTTYQYSVSGVSYCLTATNGNVAYNISSSNTAPVSGVCPGHIDPNVHVNSGIVTTLAGSYAGGFADGTGSAASFNQPGGIAVDAGGNVYVSDTANYRIRKITPAGVVTTIAGSSAGGFADGTGSAAKFAFPRGLAVDPAGDVIVADYSNNRIRKVTPAGVVTTLAGSGSSAYVDGTGTAASFNGPYGVATDSSGNIYVADTGNNRIRKITPAGVVTTAAGSGSYGAYNAIGTSASFWSPFGLASDPAGNLYIADTNNSLIRKFTASSSAVSTLAGASSGGYADGTGSTAKFSNPKDAAVDSYGNVYVADSSNQRIRKITTAGVVTTLAGSGASAYADGTGTAASFYGPSSITVDSNGDLYVIDGNRVRKIN